MQQPNMTMQDWLSISLRRKWILIVPMIICTGLALFLAFKLPPYYLSSTLIIIEPQKVPLSYVTPTDTTPIEARLNTLQQQIMSRTKLIKIIKEFNMDKVNAPYGLEDPFSKMLVKAYKKISNSIKELMGMDITVKPEVPSLEGLVEKMRENIKVEILGESRRVSGSAFTISYVGRHPETTMKITNAIASLYINENLKIREQYSEGTSDFLESELQKAELELEEQEKALREYKEKFMGSLPEQLDTNLRTLDRLQMQLQNLNDSLISEKNRKVLLEEQISSIMSRSKSVQGTEVTASFPGSPVILASAPLRVNLERLKTELSELLSLYKENYPDVIIKRNSIKELERLIASKDKEAREQTGMKLADEYIKGVAEDKNTPGSLDEWLQNPVVQGEFVMVKSQLRDVQSTINTLKKRERELRKQIRLYEKRVEDIPANEQKLSAILRNYQMSQGNYQSLLGKKLNARLAENLEKKQKGERFRIIDPANLPEKPFKPNKFKIVFVGFIAGLGLGAGLIYIVEFSNPAFRKPEDFDGFLEQPVLASIPFFSVDKKLAKSKLRVSKGQKKAAV